MRRWMTVLSVSLGILASCGGGSETNAGVFQDWKPFATNPVLQPGGGVFSTADPTILYEPDRPFPWRMWFGYASSSPSGLPHTQVGYAESTDGKTWSNYRLPALPSGPVGSWDALNAETPTVIQDDSDPDPQKKYKMWYSGLHALGESVEVYRIGYAYSADGLVWTKLPESPLAGDPEFAGLTTVGLVMKARPDQYTEFPGVLVNVTDPDVIRVGGLYRMWYTAHGFDATPKIRGAIGYATSVDGIHWTARNAGSLSPLAVETAPPSSGIITAPTVLWDGSRLRMWYDVRLQSSPDMGEVRYIAYAEGVPGNGEAVKWQRFESPAFVATPGQPPRWLGPGADVVRVGATYYLYYCAFPGTLTTLWVNGASWTP